ncbi:uncharacterized protein [Halyomorpha halys]|uniref:uncharacterized protein n=1 Tax=Halyomorpha halys TaxID=286706 RepID=UPI0006D51457|nr:uncharacterized protein LOC106687669 [Halyomorpha halys]
MMKVYVSVFIVSAFVASSSATKLDLNDKMDMIFNRSNRAKKNHRLLDISTGEIAVLGSTTVDFAQGVLLGLDSLSRTGDCIAADEGIKKTFNLQIGLKLMVLALDKVSVRRNQTSAFFRICDNSLNFIYTINNVSSCHVTVETLLVERFQNVLFGFSKTDFDGTDINDLFQNGIRTWLNKWLDTLHTELEKRLQFRCTIPMVKEEIPPTNVTEAFLSLIEDIAIF